MCFLKALRLRSWWNVILSDRALHALLEQLIPDGADHMLVNSASIDIRIGRDLLKEDGPGKWKRVSVGVGKDQYLLKPKEFVLVSTYETIYVPNGYAVDLRLKSSRAREGYDHALAFWVDPGWYGILTMEVMNNMRYTELPLELGMRFGQMIVHQLDAPAEKPYCGKYKGAQCVELSQEL
mgnify:CR=1 FL=1